MANHTRPSEVKQAQIIALISHGVSYSEIVRNLKRNIAIITRFILHKVKRKINPKRTPNPKSCMQRKIVNTALRSEKLLLKSQILCSNFFYSSSVYARIYCSFTCQNI